MTEPVPNLANLLEQILQELRREHTDSLWSIEDVAAYLGFSTSHTRTHIICKPGFPQGLLIHRTRRWNSDEVRQWAARQKRVA